ncbi:unnamed protein product [Ectocarpus sp. 12 AP-2014]
MTAAEEAAAQAELLENVVATAQRLIKAEKDKSKITPTSIAEKVKLATAIFESDSPQIVDQAKAVNILIQRFSHWIGKSTTLKDDAGHFDWLSAARKHDWHYWRRYRDYLESKLSDTVVDGLDEATDDILGLLEDPERTDPWDRRGLVVGHVQSGKTSNYSGLICKAADAGYKIIIVLAGMHNNLRSQTQVRLEESFLGYETTIDRDPGMPIGVAEFGEDLKTNSATTRAENGDFSNAIAKHFHGISPEERPWLFVVKKQKTVLTALLHWIQKRVADSTNANTNQKLVTKLPLLMIDDEADNASVDTARMFGIMTKEGRKGALPLSRDITDHYDPGWDSGWMPPRHKKTHLPTHEGQEAIPPSLCEAICSFVLACSVRELRGQAEQHSSMLIHVTRYVDVQNHVREQVEKYVRRMRQRITRNIGAKDIQFQLRRLWEEDFLPIRDQVAELSPAEECPPMMPSWDEIYAVLPDVLSDIEVRSINGTAKDALDYATPGAALKVIAIGGDKLARGLTLEGLSVSYFVRTTKMYDTLMQMGRWFGYRPGYLDLCRLYTSPDLVKWFGHIADASEELRDEFDFMAEAKLTPEQYGLKVMSHEVLTVTSPLKMRNAQTISLTYSGTRPQTILFHRDAQIQQQNLDATDTLITSLGSSWEKSPKYERDGDPHSWPKARLWKDVEVSKVLEFLNSYVTHPNATSAKAAVLTEFISKMVDTGQLTQWSIALFSGGLGDGDEHTFPGGEPTTKYAFRKTDDPLDLDKLDTKKFSIGVLTDPKDEGIDLADDVWRKALKLTQEAWKPDSARGRKEPPSAPSGKGIREARGRMGGDADRGLLLLYPLTPYFYKSKNKAPERLIVPGWRKPIMAFAIAFPASRKSISVEYEVNLLYWMQEYGPSE